MRHSARVTSPLGFWERQHRPVASWVCYLDSLTGHHPQKDPMLGLMFSCHCKCKSKILNTFQVRGPAFALHTEPRKLCSWYRLEAKALTSYCKKSMLGLPWWLSGKESACQCRGHGFDPWCRRISHTSKQLSLWATTIEPVRLSPRAATTEPTCHKLKPSHSSASAPQQEKPLQ